jgi:hypothetical protein
MPEWKKADITLVPDKLSLLGPDRLRVVNVLKLHSRAGPCVPSVDPSTG